MKASASGLQRGRDLERSTLAGISVEGPEPGPGGRWGQGRQLLEHSWFWKHPEAECRVEQSRRPVEERAEVMKS